MVFGFGFELNLGELSVNGRRYIGRVVCSECRGFRIVEGLVKRRTFFLFFDRLYICIVGAFFSFV